MENREWQEVRLGEVINLKRGYDLPNSKRTFGKHPIISSSGVTDYHNEYMKEPPGVVTGRYGTIGKVFYSEQSYWPLNTTLYVTDFKGNDSKFIFYFLQSFDFEKFSDKSSVPGINRNHLHSEIVNVPPLSEQKAIAGVLSSLDDKIDLLHQQNQTLEALAETLFRQWFIEEAKEDWESCKVIDQAIHYKKSIIPNKHPDTTFTHYSIPSYDGGKKPVTENGIDIQSNKYSVPDNCILFSKLNPHKDKRVWLLLDNLNTNSVCSTEFQIIKPKEDYLIFFLYGWLTYSNNYNEIASGVGGTSGSHQRIDPNSIFEFNSIKTNINYYINYDKLVRPIYSKINDNLKQIQTLTQLRDTLLPKLMSGEVRVKYDFEP